MTFFTSISSAFSAFRQYNGYTPDAGRPYINADAAAIVTSINCFYESSVEQGNTRNIEDRQVFAGDVQAGGTANALPTGWSSVNGGTGITVVTHNLGLTATNHSVAVTSSDTNVRLVQRVVKAANSFQVVSTDAAGTLVNGAVNFILTRNQPQTASAGETLTL